MADETKALSDCPAADDYRERRAAFRQEAADEVRSRIPQAIGILETTDELVCLRTQVVCGRDLRGLKHGVLAGRLMASFCRTHMIATDLVRQCELIEAAVLIRKQFELVARFRELEGVEDASHLEGKTPNVREIAQGLRKMYGEYSAIAHSSKEEPLALLGDRLQGDERRTVLHPGFNHNALAVAQHTGILALDFLEATRVFSQRADLDATVTQEFGERALLMWCADLQ